MKILCLHSDYIKVRPTKKAIKDADTIDKKEFSSKETLVVFTAVEKGDEENPENVIKNGIKEIVDVYNQVKAKEIVIYPYVHLTTEPSSPGVAKEVLNGITEGLKKDYKVSKMPFGWYKAFEISVKGHPLSELSREIRPTEEKEGVEEVDEDEGELIEIKVILKDGTIKKNEEIEDEKIKTAIKSELGELKTSGKEPPHIKLMRHLEIAEPETRVSDSGNFRFYPKGQFMMGLMMELGRKICTEKLGAVEMRTPYIINPEQENVKIMMGKFPERLYRVLPGSKKRKQEFRLRPACDYGIWSIFKDMVISYKQLPFAVYEYDLLWRYEQSGELVGLNRLRNATMANLHTMCADMKQAFEEFERQVKEFAINFYYYFDIKPEIVVLNCKKEFFEEHKNTFNKWVKTFDMPIIVKLFKTMKTYKIAWVDVIAFDKLNRPVEVDTVQLDTESANWWDISYTTKDNKKGRPFFLHTGFGAERFLSEILEDASGKKNPTFPLWLSPTQVRLCPVNDSFIKYCEKIGEKIEKENIRIDIDDRAESVQKKIRDSEVEWVPMIVVVGEKEKKSGKLAVRFRETGKVENMEPKELVKKIKKETKDYPFKPLPLPRLLTKRPKFVG